MSEYTDTVVTIVKFNRGKPQVMLEPMLFDNYEKATNFLLDVYYGGNWGCRMQESSEDKTQHMFEFQHIKDANIVDKIYVSIKTNRNEHMKNMIIFNDTNNE